jgi:hypothetical protein
MLYIHRITCISPQETWMQVKLDTLRQSVDNTLKVIEPSYDGIPAAILRRMSKSVKMGVGAALPILRETIRPNGILTGTGNSGMEDSVRFLKQIIDYDEGMLTPGNFVQSTPNGIASQTGLFSGNKGYNSTYVHRGLAFEHALTDAAMLLEEHPGNSYLVGGVDAISGYNYQLEKQAGWYKKEKIFNKDLYAIDSPGSIAGEGAVLLLADHAPAGAIAKIKAISTLHSREEATVTARLLWFLERHLPAGEKPDLLLSGENGDNRSLPWYTACEAMMGPGVTVARFKHMCGEYPTASAFALWLACNLPDRHSLPDHMIKKEGTAPRYKNILIYNNHQYHQHSIILVEKLL